MTAPEPQEVWSAWREGLGSPLAAVEAFRTSLRGNLLEAEYLCFGSAWKARHGLSQVGYREFRDRLLGSAPHLRWAIVHSEVLLLHPPEDGRATVLLTYRGRRVLLHLVEEAYCEVRAGGRRLVSEPLPGIALNLRPDEEQGLLFAFVEARGVDPAAVDSFVLAREWKIDEIVVELPE